MRHSVTCKFCEQFLHFLKKKTTSYSKIFKILLRKISPPHRLTLLCSNVVKFFQWESVKSCIIYLTEKTSTAELTYIHPHMPILCPHGARISIVTFTSAHLYRTIIELEIELGLFLVLFRPGTTSVRSGLGTFFVPEPEHANHSLCS